MIEYLFSYDKTLFYLINRLPHTTLSDIIFGAITLAGYFGFIWFVAGFIIYFREKKRDRKFLFSLIIIEFLSTLVEIIVKNMVGRLRPQFVLTGVIEPFDFYHNFSFPSGHAVISFAAAYVLARKKPKMKWLFYSLAVIISFSRIYLGKHFPSDVIAGAIIGLGIGYISTKFQIPSTKSQTITKHQITNKK
ncbi:phosphatase PAP2 family protein [Candidatus Gottesmanbacteria bacterium]|nr:phosphatase PAP2 family protein [Candidatus Gottesmanbacteria bacterium]